MPLGVTHIDTDAAAHKAKHQEHDLRIEEHELLISQTRSFITEMAVTIEGSGLAVVESEVEPPHPVNGNILWLKTASGSPTVVSISLINSSGVREYLWLAEST